MHLQAKIPDCYSFMENEAAFAQALIDIGIIPRFAEYFAEEVIAGDVMKATLRQDLERTLTNVC